MIQQTDAISYCEISLAKSSRKRRYDEDESFDVRVMLEIGSRKSQYYIPSTLPGFYNGPMSTTLHIYGPEAFNPDIERKMGGDKRLLSTTITKISHFGEPYSKKQCFTYIPKDSGIDNCGSVIKENINGEKCVKQEFIDRSSIRACHICHRKPSQKSELEFYSRCESCLKSTCFICLRQCDGMKREPRKDGESQFDLTSFLTHRSKMTSGLNIHHEKICSHCCVEDGATEEVRCLGCLNTEM